MKRAAENGFNRVEFRTLAGLETPERIQRFLDEDIGYNKEPGGVTCHSPRRVLRDDDHVLGLFRVRSYCGAIARSNHADLRHREPVYRTLRELAMSYFEHYCNLKGEKTLRTYSPPVNLTRFDSTGLMTAEEDVWAIPEHLVLIPQIRLLAPGMDRKLARTDARLFAAEYPHRDAHPVRRAIDLVNLLWLNLRLPCTPNTS